VPADKQKPDVLQLLAFPNGKIHNWLSMISKHIEKNGSGFVVGKSLTIADLKLASGLRFLLGFNHIPKSILKTYPAVAKYNSQIIDLIETKKGAPKPKLTYFAFGGRAQCIRDALAIGGFDYDDKHIVGTDLAPMTESGELPMGSVPVMEWGGETYTQSNAILTYWGLKANLVPECSMGAARVQEVLHTCEDLFTYLGPTLALKGDDQKNARDTLLQTSVHKWLTGISYLISKSKGVADGYVVGSKLSIADLKLIGTLEFILRLDHIPKDLYTTKYPAIAQYASKCRAAVDKAKQPTPVEPINPSS